MRKLVGAIMRFTMSDIDINIVIERRTRCTVGSRCCSAVRQAGPC